MTKYRSILASVLAFIAVLFICFSDPAAARPAKKLTYTAEQIASIQEAAAQVVAMRDRFPELNDLIQKQDWIFARNFIHGPLGELRVKMSQVTRDLLPDAQKAARKAAKEVAEDLEDLDRVADERNYQAAVRYYSEAIKDLDTFFSVLPQG
jgi:photosystem II protein PsbQ